MRSDQLASRAAAARRGALAREVEEGAPHGGLPPPAIGVLCDAAQVGLEARAPGLGELGRGGGGFEPGLRGEGGGRGVGDEGCEGGVEGDEVGEAFLDDEGAEGQAEGDVVEGEGLLGGGG